MWRHASMGSLEVHTSKENTGFVNNSMSLWFRLSANSKDEVQEGHW